jgi:acetyl esterase/lipase
LKTLVIYWQITLLAFCLSLTIIDANAQADRRQHRISATTNWQAAAVGTTTNIPYVAGGTDPLQTLDIYSPSGAQALPVVVFIHGGGFGIGDKKNGALAKATTFNSAGMIFVSLNYRLSPAVKYPAHVQDVGRAIAWIHKNISRFGGDPDKIVVMGHSAGAELAALVATDERYLQAAGSNLTILKGAILLDGATYDMTRAMAGRGKAQLEPVFGNNPKVWQDASVINHVQPQKGIPPFLIIYVSFRGESKAQAEQLASLLNSAGSRAAVKPAFNKTHKTLNQEFGQAGDAPTEEVFSFLNSLPGFSKSQ